MAKITVAHKPDLTKEQAQQIFEDRFGERYRVKKFTGPFRDFFVEKGPFVAVAVKLEQTEKETRFIYNAYSPRWWARALLGVLFAPIAGRGLSAEVKTFIETARQFN